MYIRENSESFRDFFDLVSSQYGLTQEEQEIFAEETLAFEVQSLMFENDLIDRGYEDDYIAREVANFKLQYDHWLDEALN